MDTTMQHDDDTAGPGKIEQIGAASAQTVHSSYTVSREPQTALSGQISPSRELLIRQLENETAVFLKAKVWKAEHGDTDYRIAGPSMARLLRDARNTIAANPAPDVAALTVKLADVETERDQARELADQADGYLRRAEIAEGERDELASKVQALSEPRVFNVAGLVDADLAERYENLRSSYANLEAQLDALKHELASEIAKVAGLWCRVEDVEAERDTAEKRAEAFRETILEYAGQLTDAIEQRDAAAENARRERDRHGTYDAETLAAAGEQLGRNALTLGTGMLTASGGEATRYRAHFVESILRAAGLVSQREQKPRCRVVTSPRFYSEEERLAAAGEVSKLAISRHGSGDTLGVRCLAYVDAVAQALGMRRAAK
jgi:hypothetical protein